MPDYRHAGTFWPANAGGEHPNAETILGLPGSGALVFVVADSARWWWRQIKARAHLAVWRGLPRPDRLPAHLGWEAKRVAAECVNLWDEQPHSGTEWFTPLNELQFRKESGEDWQGYADMAAKLGRLRVALRAEFARRGHDVRLLFPAWVPGDDLERADEWLDEAIQWDGFRLHAYNNALDVRARYWAHRTELTARYGDRGRLFPILVDETNANHTGADERAMLVANAEVCRDDPACLGFCWYIWETRNAGEEDLSVWGNPDRLALFLDPPTASAPARAPAPEPEPPVSEPWQPRVDPWEWWTAEQIAAASGCPVDAVSSNWPILADALAACGLWEQPVAAALIGTVAIETASTFRPVREAFYLGEPEPAESHRKTLPYYPHYGRGYIQLTHASNYARYSAALAELWEHTVPERMLVDDPEMALEAYVSAAVAALYFRDHGREDGVGIPEAARARDWREVRRLVQGGSAGLDRLTQIAATLLAAPVPEPSLDGYVFPVEGYSGAVELHWGSFPGGSDLFAPAGTPVLALHAGTVVYRATAGIGGNAVQISGDDGLQSYYAHGDRAPAVQLGQRVEAGAYLFGVGESGNAAGTGPHLHLGLGREILTGSGPSGGCGSDFDAVSFLRRLVAAAPAPAPPAEELAALRAEVERLRTVTGYLTVDVRRDLDAAIAALQAISNALRDHAA